MALSGEDQLTGWLRKRLEKSGYYRIGDDAALIPEAPASSITVDQQIEGVHFPTGLTAHLIAKRLLAVNLSDLAAMGAVPQFALVTLSCPDTFDKRAFFRSLLASCERFDVELIGGDLARGDSVATSMTLLGSRHPKGRWTARDQARVNDQVWVGGRPGVAATGLRLVELGCQIHARSFHIPSDLGIGSTNEQRAARRAIRSYVTPRPQLELGHWLARQPRAAAIDLSDGLSLDLHRLCKESGVGAAVDLSSIDEDTALEEVQAKIGLDHEEIKFTGGEDYCLLFTLGATAIPPPRFRCWPIGKITADLDVVQVTNGARTRLNPSGWDHFKSS